MKLLRYGAIGQEKPGCIDANGQIRDLSSHLHDITTETLAPQNLNKLKSIDLETLAIIPNSVRIATPYKFSGKFIAVGLNYSDHAAEVGAKPPKEPILFSKWCLPTGPNDNVILPPDSNKSDWEVELGIVIGTKAQHVSQESALNHIAGYCIVNDVSERSYQLERSGTWDKGKGYDTFGPIGPWLVTTDEITNPNNLNLWLDLNGERQQTGNTSTMIFDVTYLVHYISQFTTLFPGDIIATGTPPGVGMGKNPPRFLQEGDTMHLFIEGLGEQIQTVTRK